MTCHDFNSHFDKPTSIHTLPRTVAATSAHTRSPRGASLRELAMQALPALRAATARGFLRAAATSKPSFISWRAVPTSCTPGKDGKHVARSAGHRATASRAVGSRAGGRYPTLAFRASSSSSSSSSGSGGDSSGSSSDSGIAASPGIGSASTTARESPDKVSREMRVCFELVERMVGGVIDDGHSTDVESTNPVRTFA